MLLNSWVTTQKCFNLIGSPTTVEVLKFNHCFLRTKLNITRDRFKRRPFFRDHHFLRTKIEKSETMSRLIFSLYFRLAFGLAQEKRLKSNTVEVNDAYSYKYFSCFFLKLCFTWCSLFYYSKKKF